MTGPHRGEIVLYRTKRRRPGLPLAVLTIVLVVATVVLTWPQQHPVHRRATAPQHRRRVATPVTSWNPVFGVYTGPGAVTAAETYTQSGGPVDYALDFIQSTSWASISDPAWTMQQWRGSRFHMVFGVPMLPDRGATLANGATGAYDADFAALGTMLVADGQGNAVLMIGWDPLQPGTRWQVKNAAQASAYVAYWRQIASTMRAVPGSSFQFEWDGGSPTGTISAPAVYPGSDDVTFIATNAFDRLLRPTSGSRWTAVADADEGPNWYAAFAARQGKPLVIAEWGLVPTSTSGGGGDDVAFVRSFLQWCRQHQVALVVTWDYGNWKISSGAFASSEAVLASDGNTAGSAPAVRALQGSATPGT